MKTLKQEYIEFLNDNFFKGFQLRKPLFYSWDYGLRFDLQVGETNTDQYFNEVVRRSATLFEIAFDSLDSVYFVLMDREFKRNKIRFSNYAFRQLSGLLKSEISYTKATNLYYPNDKFDKRNIAIIKLSPDRINFRNILTAIAHSDFPPRKPRLDELGMFTAKEVYFVNIDKKLVFNMYDDRGLDIISSDIETLRPIYTKYKNWLLEYDKKQMDKIFE